MKVLSYQIELLEPALVPALEGDPNSAVSFHYLPGSILRGAMIRRYLGTGQFDAGDLRIRRLFFDGTTRYLNGYLVDRLSIRSLPVPLSWQRDKNIVALATRVRPAPIYDFALEPQNGSEEDWNEVGNSFFVIDSTGVVRLIQPKRVLSIHTQRDRAYGRARSESGAVYRYESLAARQTFAAEVLVDDEELVDPLMDLLDGEVKLGGARSAGYGRAYLCNAGIEDQGWREASSNQEIVLQGERILLTFLSHAIIRDSCGQLQTDTQSIAREVEVCLDLPRESLHPTGNAFLATTVVAGFNRKWGLPLPQAQAVQMGSVIELQGPGFDADGLRQIENQGIGERRVEGFGRLAVNWHTASRLDQDTESGSDSKPAAYNLQPDSTSENLAFQMAERLLRNRLDGDLTRRANDLGQIIKKPRASASQISRLRMVLRDVLKNTDSEEARARGRARLVAYLKKLEQRRVTREQFTTDRIQGKSLLEWLIERVNDEDNIWTHFIPRGDEVIKISIGSASLELSPRQKKSDPLPERNQRLAYEYNLRLAEAVLRRLAKNKQAKGGGE